jgi:hypothetical protein
MTMADIVPGTEKNAPGLCRGSGERSRPQLPPIVRGASGNPWQYAGVEELNAATAVSAGGWDPRFAVTLAVVSHASMAAALIDSNGDEADIDLDQYERGADGYWHETVSGNVGDAGTSWTPQIAATWGRADPGAQVDVEYLGHRHSAVASASGWWLFIGPAMEDSDALPRPIDRSS